jgi:hypothetical protein
MREQSNGTLGKKPPRLGRFLIFIGTPINPESLPKNLTERRFRS